MSENMEKKTLKPEMDQKKSFNKKPRFDRKPDTEFEEKVVKINRITKVTKGGRRFRFAAIVVIGDSKGRVGLGTAKANEVPDAIKKAIKDAKKNIIKIPITKKGATIPHEITGKFGGGKILLKPAKEGTGVIAGGPVRAVVELAGIKNINAKSLGSQTTINMIKATLEGLKALKTPEQVASLRSKKVNEL